MNDFRTEKLRRFVNDPGMSEAVYEAILKVFLKPKPNAQVNVQAASFIAIGQLQEAFRDLDRFKSEKEDGSGSGRQVGL